MKDHPTIRILFYIGLVFGGPLMYFTSNIGNHGWDIILVVIAVIIAIWIIKQTDNFRNWNQSLGPLKLRIASVLAFFVVMIGGTVILGTIVFIPWLINGIRNDLKG